MLTIKKAPVGKEAISLQDEIYLELLFPFVVVYGTIAGLLLLQLLLESTVGNAFISISLVGEILLALS